MLNYFLVKEAQQKQEEEVTAKLAAWMTTLPVDYLRKVASGQLGITTHDCLKVAHDDNQEWLMKFKGTPLFEQAATLERAELQNDIARQQFSEQRRIERESKPGEEQFWHTGDHIRMQKKMLDLQLMELEHQLTMSEEATATAPVEPAAVMPATPEAVPAREVTAAANKLVIRSMQHAIDKVAANNKNKMTSENTGNITVYPDEIPIERMATKAAESLSKMGLDLNALKAMAMKNPKLTASLAGAGIGAAGGALAGGPEHRLSGALGGAALGAGAGHAAHGVGTGMQGGKNFGESLKSYAEGIKNLKLPASMQKQPTG